MSRWPSIVALSVVGLASLIGCGDSDSDSDAGSGGCDPEDLVWVYARITDPESTSYPTAIYRLDQGAETRLTDDDAASGPSVSPDGGRIAFERGSEGDPESAGYSRYRLYVVDSDGGGEQPLLDPEYELPERDDGAPSWDTDPVWSPDGSHVAFVRNAGFTESAAKPEDVHAVMVVPASGGEPRPLPGTGSQLHDAAPAWSADSTRVAWVTETTATLHWAAVNGNDSGTVRLPDAFDAPAWTLDGAELLVPYDTDPYGDGGEQGLYRVDVATGEQTKLAMDPVISLWALPTGELAGVEPVGEDAGRIVVMDPDEPQQRTEITTVDGTVEGLATAVPDDPDGWAACT